MLYYKDFGKLFEITNIFKDVNEANKFMENNTDKGVMAVINGVIFISNINDKGIEL